MFRRCVFSIVSMMLVLGVVILTLFWQSYRAYSQEPDADVVSVVFTVEEGESLSSVAARLDRDGVIASEFWFKVTAALSNRTTTIKPGVFTVTTGDSYNDILTTLSASQSDEVTLTIPEGYSLDEMGALVTSKFSVTLDEWNQLTGVNSSFNSHEFVVRAQKPSDVDLEG